VTVRTAVPINLKIALTISDAAETVTVTGGSTSEMLENVPTAHTDVDQSLISRLPVRSPGNGLSDVITLAAPGVVADSNGFFQPVGRPRTDFVFNRRPTSFRSAKQIVFDAVTTERCAVFGDHHRGDACGIW